MSSLIYFSIECAELIDVLYCRHALVLQLEVVWRWWWPWFRRSKVVTVHLSQSTEEPLEVYQKQMNADCDLSNGPLWRATLVHPQHSSQETVLVLTPNHVISDGTTNMLLSRDLLTIINGLITGQKYSTPWRDLAPPIPLSRSSTEDLFTALRLFFWLFRNGLFSLLQGKTAPLLPSTPSTNSVSHDFSKEVTTQLNCRCKEEGVRVSSVLMAACTLAYFRTAQQERKCLTQMQVSHETAVNLRRYCSDMHHEASGSVAFSLFLTHHVTHDTHFWDLARKIQQDLYKSLDQDKSPLHISQLGYLLSMIFPLNQLLAWCGLRSITYSHVFLTNMGNLHSLLPATYNGPVHITRLLRSFAAHYLGMRFGVVTQTFAGQMLISIDHYSTKTTSETASCFLSNLVKILTDIATHSSPTLAQDPEAIHANTPSEITTSQSTV